MIPFSNTKGSALSHSYNIVASGIPREKSNFLLSVKGEFKESTLIGIIKRESAKLFLENPAKIRILGHSCVPP